MRANDEIADGDDIDGLI